MSANTPAPQDALDLGDDPESLRLAAQLRESRARQKEILRRLADKEARLEASASRVLGDGGSGGGSRDGAGDDESVNFNVNDEDDDGSGGEDGRDAEPTVRLTMRGGGGYTASMAVSPRLRRQQRERRRVAEDENSSLRSRLALAAERGRELGGAEERLREELQSARADAIETQRAHAVRLGRLEAEVAAAGADAQRLRDALRAAEERARRAESAAERLGGREEDAARVEDALLEERDRNEALRARVAALQEGRDLDARRVLQLQEQLEVKAVELGMAATTTETHGSIAKTLQAQVDRLQAQCEELRRQADEVPALRRRLDEAAAAWDRARELEAAAEEARALAAHEAGEREASAAEAARLKERLHEAQAEADRATRRAEEAAGPGSAADQARAQAARLADEVERLRLAAQEAHADAEDARAAKARAEARMAQTGDALLAELDRLHAVSLVTSSGNYDALDAAEAAHRAALRARARGAGVGGGGGGGGGEEQAGSNADAVAAAAVVAAARQPALLPQLPAAGNVLFTVLSATIRNVREVRDLREERSALSGRADSLQSELASLKAQVMDARREVVEARQRAAEAEARAAEGGRALDADRTRADGLAREADDLRRAVEERDAYLSGLVEDTARLAFVAERLAGRRRAAGHGDGADGDEEDDATAAAAGEDPATVAARDEEAAREAVARAGSPASWEAARRRVAEYLAALRSRWRGLSEEVTESRQQAAVARRRLDGLQQQFREAARREKAERDQAAAAHAREATALRADLQSARNRATEERARLAEEHREALARAEERAAALERGEAEARAEERHAAAAAEAADRAAGRASELAGRARTACRLMYRALRPLANRVEELRAQKGMLARRNASLERAQEALESLVEAMGGAAAPSGGGGGAAGAFQRRRRGLSGAALFRAGVVAVLAAKRLARGRRTRERFGRHGVVRRGGGGGVAADAQGWSLLPDEAVPPAGPLPELDVSSTERCLESLRALHDHFAVPDRSESSLLALEDRHHGGGGGRSLDVRLALARRGGSLLEALRRASGGDNEIGDGKDDGGGEAEDDPSFCVSLIRKTALALSGRVRDLEREACDAVGERDEAERRLGVTAKLNERLSEAHRKSSQLVQQLERRVEELQGEMTSRVPHDRFRALTDEHRERGEEVRRLGAERARLAALVERSREELRLAEEAAASRAETVSALQRAAQQRDLELSTLRLYLRRKSDEASGLDDQRRRATEELEATRRSADEAHESYAQLARRVHGGRHRRGVHDDVASIATSVSGGGGGDGGGGGSGVESPRGGGGMGAGAPPATAGPAAGRSEARARYERMVRTDPRARTPSGFPVSPPPRNDTPPAARRRLWEEESACGSSGSADAGGTISIAHSGPGRFEVAVDTSEWRVHESAGFARSPRDETPGSPVHVFLPSPRVGGAAGRTRVLRAPPSTSGAETASRSTSARLGPPAATRLRRPPSNDLLRASRQLSDAMTASLDSASPPRRW